MSAFTMTALLVLALVATALGQRDPPQIKTDEGHVYIKTGNDVVQNVTDLLSSKKAMPLFEDQEKKLAAGLTELNETLGPRLGQVERRNTKNVVDLLDELATTNKAANVLQTAANVLQTAVVAKLTGMETLLSKQVEAEAQKAGGAGTTAKAAGQPWNPIKVPETPLSDGGGHAVRIIFPNPRLVSSPAVKVYSCKFTLLDSKGSPTKTVRVSADVAADTKETFACVTPAWSPAGSGLPPTATWKTAFAVYENGREMPSPKSPPVFAWQPATPKMTIATATEAKAYKSKATKFIVPFKINYPYGAEGYKDVSISAKGSSNALSSVSIGAPNTGAAARTLSFTLTDKTGKKTNAYTIELTAKSTKTGLSSKATITINYDEKAEAFGKGGSLELVKDGPFEEIFKKVNKGTPDSWELCYSRQKHGWSSSQFNSRCRQKTGHLFVIQRRGGSSSHKGRVFGGYAAHSWPAHHQGYHHENWKKNFLFRINPSNPDKIEWAHTFRYPQYSSYPGNPSYMMCFGGGHDLCSRNDGHQWAHFGHTWRSTVGNSGDDGWFYGQHSYNAKHENDLYEVYIVK